MNKKYYVKPAVEQLRFADDLLAAASVLDSSLDSQSISVTDEEYNGEFQSKGSDNVWDD